MQRSIEFNEDSSSSSEEDEDEVNDEVDVDGQMDVEQNVCITGCKRLPCVAHCVSTLLPILNLADNI